MTQFVVGKPLTTELPSVVVDAGLPVGSHRFRLVVVDSAGNQSRPTEVVVQVTRRTVVRPGQPVGPVITRDTAVPSGATGRATAKGRAGKPAVKSAAKAAAGPATKPAAKPRAKPAPTSATKGAAKPATKAAAKPAPKPAAKSAGGSATKPASKPRKKP